MRHEQQLIELAASRHHLLTTAMVRQAGITEAQWERLRQDDIWIPLTAGVWHHAATPRTWEMEVHAGAMWLGRDAALYGGAALRWSGVEGNDSARASFLTPRGRRHLPPWLELHTTTRWDPRDLVNRHGVRTCNATRAIIDLASTASPRSVESAIDHSIRRRLTSVPTLTARLAELSGSGRAGTRLMQTLLLDSGGESFLEREFLRLLRRNGLPRPAAQVTYRRDGVRAIRVDFEYVDLGLVIEVSGKRGHSSDRDRAKDNRRRNELVRRGKTVVEFTTGQVLDDPGYVISTLRDQLPVAGSPRNSR